MAVLPHPWRAYARLQEQLSRNASVDGHSQGLEAGLNRLLEFSASAAQPTDADIDRAVASAARRDRYQQRLRTMHFGDAEATANPFGGLQAREDLRIIKKTVTDRDWGLLCAAAAGHDYTAIARRAQATPVSLRARVSRARKLCLTAIVA